MAALGGICTVLFLAISLASVNAQQPVKLAKLINDTFAAIDYDGIPYVRVPYESNNTILLQGELLASQFNTPDLTFNADLWAAMDLLKDKYGFKLQQVMTSGVGSVGNPTKVYLLMTK